MAHVVVINPFEVPDDRDDEFLTLWEEANTFMERQKGYVGTRLHRSVDRKARFRFINVAEWESPQDFYAALQHPDFVAFRDTVPFPHYPSVYEVMGT